ncbi:MAG: phosphoadenosine phosphosulfate reductase family protein [Cyanobacteriota bacterium]
MDEAERLMFEGWAKLPSFRRKVEQAKATIREALAIAPAYVAWSLGKDSTVLLHLAQQIQPDILAAFHAGHWMDSYDNYSEVRSQYCQRFQTNLIEVPDDSDPFDFLNKSTTASAFKQTIPEYVVALLGLRTEESKNRRRTILNHGLIHQYKSGLWRACPLAFWGWRDIWAYHVTYDLPYLKSYDLTDRSGAESRTTAHIKPCRGNSALAETVRTRLEQQSLAFRELRNLYCK